jgi:hypothetical protein
MVVCEEEVAAAAEGTQHKLEKFAHANRTQQYNRGNRRCKGVLFKLWQGKGTSAVGNRAFR